MSGRKVDVLVVGAGMTGLVAAKQAQEAGRSVLVVDKGRSVGGRLATRRLGKGAADHGAQFFTARTPEFQAAIERWMRLGLVYLWAMGWSTGSFGKHEEQGHPRYAVRDGMNKLAKHLAQGLDVDLNVRLVRLERDEQGWMARGDGEEAYQAHAVILTPPVPQSLALLDAGGVMLPEAERAALERLRYAPSLAGLFRIEGKTRIPPPGAVQRPAEAITWIADNRMKGISPDETVVTVHGGGSYSRRYWNSTDKEILGNMQEVLARYLVADARIVEGQLKRWRYAFPETVHPERALRSQNPLPLIFAGDAFGGPRVEGAYLSGLAAGAALQEEDDTPP
ncbi:MAG: FAD-dependent oxidoreductase [Caldilineae bacterium]|nr:MAG: FAD-dependent oxidoreductase [Caldilineae bacterium]